MRIGLISPPWLPVPPLGYGGIELVVDRLARGLVDAGHEVLLAAPGDSTCPVPLVPGLPDAAAHAELTDHSLVELRHVKAAYAAMQGMDLVHDHTIAGPLYRYRPVSLPVVTTNHGAFVYGLGDLYQAMSDVTIVAISEHQASTATNVRVNRVIHHGVDLDTVPVGDGRGGYACFLGRMCPEKGIREAILIARRAGVPLLVAAKMHQAAEIEFYRDVVEPMFGGEVEYVGELGEAAKYDLLGGAFALLNPIQWPEPFGLVMIESLATGSPVVATPTGSAPEIVDDGVTGYLRAEPDELVEVLADAANLSREACRRAVGERFSASRMVADHIDLYAEVAASRRRAGGRRAHRFGGLLRTLDRGPLGPLDDTRDIG
jgi:glycosyltransferase involved in cell wall biosynthesis